MKIAIIGSGNVGGALAVRWAEKGHEIILGVRNTSRFKGQDLVGRTGIRVSSIPEAVRDAEVVVIATPATAAVEVAQQLGDTTGKIIIDTMNMVMGRGPAGFRNTTDALLAHTPTRDIVKCFNTTGFNNMLNPNYGSDAIDVFVAGDSGHGKEVAIQLALDAGFGACYPVGGNDRFEMMEQFAWFWINLAMVQGMGREIAFKLLLR